MRYDWAHEKAFRIDEDGCLLWRGSQHSSGLPLLYISGHPRQRILVRRSILALVLGRPLEMAERAVAACEKRLCCSPLCLKAVSHSVVGKLAIARHDWTKEHARRLKIAAKHQRRWSDEEVDDMRARKILGETPKAIAERYATLTANICHILNYKSHVLRLPDAVRYAMR